MCQCREAMRSRNALTIAEPNRIGATTQVGFFRPTFLALFRFGRCASWFFQVGLILTLAGCHQIPPADVVGVYRAESTQWEATLTVKANGTWEYHVDRPSTFWGSANGQPLEPKDGR